MSAPNLDRLPKWGRELITQLTRERDEAVRAFARHRDAQTKSRVYVVRGLRDQYQYIQDNRINFEVFPGKTIEVHLKDSDLQISCNFGRLIIEPEATNVITVKGERR